MKSLSSEFNITRSRKTLEGMLRCGRGARERGRGREFSFASQVSLQLRIENDLRLSTFKCNFDAFHFTKENN